jgi:hypothetical protein
VKSELIGNGESVVKFPAATKTPRRFCTALNRVAACFAVASFSNLLSDVAQSVENITPFLPGVTIGVPVGALPPPGLYFASANTVFDMNVKNNQGQNTGIHVLDPSTNEALLYVPDIPKIFGATYGALIIQGIRAPSTSIPREGTFSNFGLVNTVISPLNLSWDLDKGFFASVGLTTYSPAFNYKVTAIQNTSRNYATLEPSLGLSYLGDGWNLTVHPLFDFNFTNPANGYKSGVLFIMDYTALHKFGNFEAGAGGTLTAQVSNDTIHGKAVAAVPGGNGYGNRAQNFTLGPVVGYDFGTVALTAYYNRSVYARNVAAGNNFWFRFVVPLISTAPAKATGLAGPR